MLHQVYYNRELNHMDQYHRTLYSLQFDMIWSLISYQIRGRKKGAEKKENEKKGEWIKSEVRVVTSRKKEEKAKVKGSS